MGKKIKTCILGNSAVGKTSIILRLIQKAFKENMPATIAIDFKSQKKIINNEEVLVEIWDTSGQDRYRSVASNFYKGADGIFLVFDITSQKSLNDLDYWVKQLAQNLDPEVPKILLANKSDLSEKIAPSAESKIKKICEEHSLMFYKVSAKKGTNIMVAYQNLLEESYKYVSKKKKDVNTSIISEDKPIRKGGCC